MPLFFRWTYYLIPRLLMGMIFSIFAIYGVVFIYIEQIATGAYTAPQWLILATAALSFVIAWQVWTWAGKWQLAAMLSKARKLCAKDEIIKAREVYKKAVEVSHSSHFSPGNNIGVISKFFGKYTEILCSAGIHDKEALREYAKYFNYFPQDKVFAGKIIPLLIASDYIDTTNLPLLRKVHSLQSGSTEFADFLAGKYISCGVYDSEAQELLINSIRRHSPVRERALRFLLPKMLEQGRIDANAQEAYWEAYSSNLQHPGLMQMLYRIAAKARSEAVPGNFSRKIMEALQEKGPVILRASEEGEEFANEPAASPARARVVIHQSQRPAFTSQTKPHKSLWEILKPLIVILSAVPKGFVSALKFVFLPIFRHRKAILWTLAAAAVIALMASGIRMVLQEEPPKPKSLEVLSDKPFTIQLAAFRQRDRAEQVIKNLLPKGVRPYLVISDGANVWYQVRLEHFNSIPEAKVRADELEAQEIISGYFIANFQPGSYLEQEVRK